MRRVMLGSSQERDDCGDGAWRRHMRSCQERTRSTISTRSQQPCMRRHGCHESVGATWCEMRILCERDCLPMPFSPLPNSSGLVQQHIKSWDDILTSRSRAVNNTVHCSSYSCVRVDVLYINNGAAWRLIALLLTQPLPTISAPHLPHLPALPVLGYSAPAGAPAPRLALDGISMAVVPCNSGHASSTSHGDAGAYQASWLRLSTGQDRLYQPP